MGRGGLRLRPPGGPAWNQVRFSLDLDRLLPTIPAKPAHITRKESASNQFPTHIYMQMFDAPSRGRNLFPWWSCGRPTLLRRCDRVDPRWNRV